MFTITLDKGKQHIPTTEKLEPREYWKMTEETDYFADEQLID